ncbi:MAG: hypothetical protein KDC53_19750, partial [Saprospiraceae bacterium]|nr:hypothetical protein [Saprospiraceae bacterium]
LLTFLDVPAFIKENRLWRGFINHKLVVVTLMIAGALFSWHLFGVASQWWDHLHVDNPIQAGVQATYLLKDMAVGGYNFVFAGAYKYLVLILMELVIFHMTLSTHAILDGSKPVLTPGIFVNAQIRMIKVTIYTFVMELVASVVIKAALSILGWDMMKTVLIFLTQCYFLGFAMIDNYNEIHHLKIRESFKHTYQYGGVAVGIGIVLYILIMVPVVGPFVGPLIGAIAATLIMHELEESQTARVFV